MRSRSPAQRWFFHRRSAWFIALASAVLVLVAAGSVQHLSWRASEAKLLGASQDLVTLLSQRMRGHEQILRGGAGLFDASTHVSRDDWQRYVAQLRLAEKFPGIQGVGYSELIEPAALPAHLARIRADGFPDYQVKPAGTRARYSAIIYLEPFGGRNLAAFGFDMLSEPTRAAAMQIAARTGNTILSAPVTLVQETHGEVQPGFLMYVPVYQHDAVLDSEAARERAVTGWVYSAFRAHDLVNRMLADSHYDIRFALFDGIDLNRQSSLLYSSEQSLPASLPELWQGNSHYSLQTLNDFGRPWTLITWMPAESDAHANQLVLLVLGLGGVISVLLFLLFSALARREERANQIAAEMRRNFQQSETALAVSAQQARAIIDNVADAILSLHDDGVIAQANPAAERLFAYTNGTMVGLDIRVLLPSFTTEQLTLLLANSNVQAPAIATAPLQEFEGRRADGSGVAIEMTLSPIPHTEPRTCIAVCRDISERRRVDRMKREFVATVSHELRTPLTSISGALDLLVSGQLATLPTALQSLVTIAHRNSRRLGDLINDLLDIEQTSRGQLTLFMEEVTVKRKLEETVAAIAVYADSLGVQLQLQHGAPDMRVSADKKRLRQVLNNLLSNAIKFSPKGGTVLINSEQRGGRVRITVTDQGPGVPKSFEPRLFEQFSRADSADARRIGGTGLGLAISKELIERMNGQIGYLPVQPHGACFYIELPLLPAQ